MSAWPLAVLQGLRVAQAKGAAREAAALRSDAVRSRSAADDLARTAERRRSSSVRGSPPVPGLAGELARGAASRSAIDREARRAAREWQRATAGADRDARRAEEAAVAARGSWGRAETLARGMERWEGQQRRARDARLERELEDLFQLEPGPALLADDLEPPRSEVPGGRLAGALELGRGEDHLLARAQRPQLALPGPVEREHDVGPDLVRLVAHQDLLSTQEGVLEDVDLGSDRISRTGGRAGDPEGQERGGQPATHQAEARLLPAASPPESLDQVGRRAAPLVERPLDEARNALRSITHGGGVYIHLRPCAGRSDGI